MSVDIGYSQDRRNLASLGATRIIQDEKEKKGDKGDSGLAGPQGLKGDKGDTGLQVSKRDKGDTGSQGPKGSKGEKGDSGTFSPSDKNTHNKYNKYCDKYNKYCNKHNKHCIQLSKNSNITNILYNLTPQKIEKNVVAGLNDSKANLNNNIIFSKTVNGGTGKYIDEFSLIITLITHSINFVSGLLIDIGTSWYYSQAPKPS